MIFHTIYMLHTSTQVIGLQNKCTISLFLMVRSRLGIANFSMHGPSSTKVHALKLPYNYYYDFQQYLVKHSIRTREYF